MHMVAAMEEVLCEVSDHEKRNAQGLPPGFRFHPTDEELITFYLAAKVFNATFSSSDVNFVEVDLNRCEPWELPEVAKMGEREWYLYSVRDRKYPTGLRTNRATGAGYWKATGKDKEVYTNSGSGPLLLIGMKKTLVFYKGRAPRGLKTRWVMHEYRLDGPFSHSHSHSHSLALASSSSSIKEEWVICRIFHKSGEKRSPPPPLVQGGHHHQLDYPSSPITTNKAAGALLELDSYHQSQSQQQLLHDAFQLASPFPNHASADQQLFFNNKSQPLQHLSQQKCTDALNTIKVKDEESTAAVPKVTKTDHHQPTPLFLPPYQQQLLDDPNNLNYWVDRLNPSSFQNSNSNSNSNIPLLVDHQIVDGGLMAYSSSGAETATANANAQVIIRDMPSSMAFNRAAGLQQQILAVESWPHPPHHL